MKLNLLNNKKGDISITLLVVMSLVVCAIGLYTFAYHVNSGLNKIAGSGAVMSLTSQEVFVENYIQNIANQTISDLAVNSKTANLGPYIKQFSLNLNDSFKNYFYLFNLSITYNAVDSKLISLSGNPALEVSIKDFVLTRTFEDDFFGVNSVSLKKDLSMNIVLG